MEVIDSAYNEPPIEVASNTDSETKIETKAKARDEGCSSIGFRDEDVDMQGYDSQSSAFDFHESEYDMEDDNDYVYEVNVDLGFERDMGSGEDVVANRVME